MQQLVRKDILYPELSYQIVGILFEVSNSLGPGYQERYYQRAISTLLRETGMRVQEQVPVKIILKGTEVAKGFVDFVVEDKVAIEIKKGERFLKQNIDQLYSYLRAADLQLGILANFTSHGLQFKRIVNSHS